MINLKEMLGSQCHHVALRLQA